MQSNIILLIRIGKPPIKPSLTLSISFPLDLIHHFLQIIHQSVHIHLIEDNRWLDLQDIVQGAITTDQDQSLPHASDDYLGCIAILTTGMLGVNDVDALEETYSTNISHEFIMGQDLFF